MREVVSSRGAAADFRVRQFHKIKIGNGAEESARSFANFLSVKQVAGILIRDAMAERIHFRGEAECSEKFGDVARFCGERAGLRVLRFVRRKEMLVFLERGAAARGVGDDGVKLFERKRGNIVSREFARGFAEAGVRGQRAAAELILGHDDFAAVGSEHANGGFVEAGKRDVGDAAGEKSHARAAGPHGRKSFAKTIEEKIVVDRREQAFALGEAEELEDADAPRDGLQAGALIEAENTRGVFDEMRSAEKVAEEKITNEVSKPGALVIALDTGTGMLDEFSVLDAGGAGGFASAAVETFVNVIDERVGDVRGRLSMAGELALGDVDHLVDTAARRIGFEIPQAIGGAGVQAQAAVNAASVVFVGGRGSGNGLRCGHGAVR